MLIDELRDHVETRNIVMSQGVNYDEDNLPWSSYC